MRRATFYFVILSGAVYPPWREGSLIFRAATLRKTISLPFEPFDQLAKKDRADSSKEDRDDHLRPERVRKGIKLWVCDRRAIEH
jgi:hypothetical protein